MTFRFTVGAVTVLALAACGGPSKPAAEPSSAAASTVTSSQATTSESASSEPTTSEATTSAVPASPAPAAAQGEKPSREFVIGKWGTNGDCALAIDLRPDGTSDGPFGNWAYGDGVISFPEEPDFKVSVTVLDDNTMESTNATSDKVTKMTRCP